MGRFANEDQDDRPVKYRTVPIIRAHGYFIPVEHVTEDQIESAKNRFTHRFYADSVCDKCPYLEDRHSDLCDDCSAYKGAVALSSVVEQGKNNYLKFPIGNKRKLVRWLKTWKLKPKLIDKTTVGDKIAPFNFVKEPWDYQAKAAAVFLEKERGIVDSPPRTGKTVLGAYVSHKLRLKTLVLAHQREWLENFHETYVGSKTQEAFTDIDPERIGFCKTLKDFQTKDVAFATFQQFFSPKGRKILEKISRMFGLLIADEVHQGAAQETAKVLAKMRSRYRLGLTGSPDRKDCLASGTPITLHDGTTKPVDLLQVGDSVLSYNHATQTIEPRRVIDAWSVTKPRRVRIRLASGREIICSECERFAYGESDSSLEYREARVLSVGDSLWLLPHPTKGVPFE